LDYSSLDWRFHYYLTNFFPNPTIIMGLFLLGGYFVIPFLTRLPQEFSIIGSFKGVRTWSNICLSVLRLLLLLQAFTNWLLGILWESSLRIPWFNFPFNPEGLI